MMKLKVLILLKAFKQNSVVFDYQKDTLLLKCASGIASHIRRQR